MKKFIAATLTCVLLLAAGICHAAQDKIHVAFYDFSRTELSEQIKACVTSELESNPAIELVDATGSYVGEINLNIFITENPEHVIFFYYMFYKGRFVKGFYTGQKDETKEMCKNIVHFFCIEAFIK